MYFAEQQALLDIPHPDPADKNAEPRTTRQKFRAHHKWKDDPEILGIHPNPAITYVWGLQSDPALTRSGSVGMSTRPFLTQQDIKTYMDNMGVSITPFFIRCLILVDRAASKATSKQEAERER